LFEAFGAYLKALSLDNMLCSRVSKIDPKRSVDLFWLLDFEFCRLAFSQETPEAGSNLKINSSLFKKLVSGGDTQTARRNYDRTDTSFMVDFTPFMAGNNSLGLDGDVNEHLIEFESIIQFLSPEEIESKRMTENELLVQRKYKVKDPSLKEKCRSLEWKLATIYLIYMNYTDAALHRGVRNENDEDTSLMGCFLKDYEITNDEDDIVPVDEIKSMNYGKDWKKIKIELEGLGIVIKKCKNRNSEFRDKMSCFGIHKKQTQQQPELATEPIFEGTNEGTAEEMDYGEDAKYL
jgi:hypothetical protein